MLVKHYIDVINSPLFKQGPVVLFLWRNAPGWPVLAVSDNVVQLLGYEAERFIRAEVDYASLIHPDDLPGVGREVQNATQSDVSSFTHHPYRIKGADERYRWIRDTTALVRKDGSVTHYVGYLMDMSDEMQKEQIQSRLAHSERILSEAQRIAKLGSWTLDLVTNELRWSEEIFRIFELDPAHFAPAYETFLDTVHPDDVRKVDAAFAESIRTKTPYHVEHRLRMRDGRIKYVVEDGHTTYDAAGLPLLSRGTVQDVTTSKQLQKQIDDYVLLIDKYIITSSTDLEGRIIKVSSAFCAISGYAESELIGRHHSIVRHPDMPASLYRAMWEALRADQTWSGEILNRSKRGKPYWVHAVISPNYDLGGAKIGYTAIRQDISDKKQVEKLSVTDRLTGLYNRMKLDEVFRYELQQSQRYGLPFAVILLDVDHFKQVNDTYGHPGGDRLLRELAALMQSTKRAADTLGRWGGEEFLVILPKTDRSGAAKVAEKLRAVVAENRFADVGHKTISAGVAVYQEGDTEERLMGRVDRALYRAKAEGRDRVVIG